MNRPLTFFIIFSFTLMLFSMNVFGAVYEGDGQPGTLPHIHFSFTYPDGAMVGRSGTWRLKVWLNLSHIPHDWSYASGLVVHNIIFVSLTATIHMEGKNHNTTTLSTSSLTWYTENGDTYGKTSLSGGFTGYWPNTQTGMHYFWAEVDLLYQEKNGAKFHDGFSIVPAFSSLFILKYSETGNWGTDIGNGVSIAFGTVSDIWGAVGSKLQHLDWGSLSKLDVLGFLSQIETAFMLIGWGIYATVTTPLTALSLIMSHTANAMTVSFFVLALVLSGIVLISFLIIIWKVIMLVKP